MPMILPLHWQASRIMLTRHWTFSTSSCTYQDWNFNWHKSMVGFGANQCTYMHGSSLFDYFVGRGQKLSNNKDALQHKILEKWLELLCPSYKIKWHDVWRKNWTKETSFLWVLYLRPFLSTHGKPKCVRILKKTTQFTILKPKKPWHIDLWLP